MKLFATETRFHQTLSLMPILEDGGNVCFKGMDGYESIATERMLEVARLETRYDTSGYCGIQDYTNFYQILGAGVETLALKLGQDIDVLRDKLVQICLSSNALREILSFVVDARLAHESFDSVTHADVLESLESVLSHMTYLGLHIKFIVKPTESGNYEFDVYVVNGNEEVHLIEGAESGYENINLKELKMAFVMLNSVRTFVEQVHREGCVRFNSPTFLQLNDVYWDIELNTPEVD